MFLAILILFLVCIYTMKSKKGRPPLASGAWPIVGHAVKFITNLEDLHELLMSYSMESIRRDTPVLIRFITTQFYVITNPEDAQAVLDSPRDVIYSYYKPWLGEGLITASDKIWKKHRKLLNPTFNQSVLDGYLPEVNQQAKSMITQLNAKVGKGKFDHAPYMDHTTLRCIYSTAMGLVVDEKDVELREQYLNANNNFSSGLIHRAKTFWLQSDFIYDWSSLKITQNGLADTLHELSKTIIKKRKFELGQIKQSGSRIEKRFKPFLELLLDMEEKGVFNTKEVQEEVDTFVATGSDTMAVTLTTTLLVISSYPEVQRNIVDELKEVFQGSLRDVEKQDLLKLKYLEAVVMESLRLLSTVPIVARTLDRAVKIGQYTLPAGSRCLVSLQGVNCHGRWGPDVEQFRPERWLEPDNCPPAHQFAAFGVGKRRCLGATFASMCLKTILAHVLRHYHVSGDVTGLRRTMKVSARPVPGDYISIERRVNTEYEGQN